MDSLPKEIVCETLLKLPTMDVGRCRCVSKQWSGLLTDPSFIDLHGNAVSNARAEALVVTETRGDGIGLEMAVLDFSSAKPVCHVNYSAPFYRPANVCNGFLLLSPTVQGWPLSVCNPIIGEKLQIPAPADTNSTCCHTYAMGFGPSTGQYKLFRLSSKYPPWCEEALYSYLDVYTLGDNDGSWRQHPQTFVNRAVCDFRSPSPAFVDGKLYVLTERWENRWVPDGILVIDVASEAHFRYRLPEEFTEKDKADVRQFEMCRWLCVAVRVVGRQLLNIWVMPPLQGLMDTDEGILHENWELRYTFSMDDDGPRKYDNRLWGVCLQSGDGMLCYQLGDCLYKYGTTKDSERTKKQVGDSTEWDHRIQLRVAPLLDSQRWYVYGSYRPSLLLPHNISFRRIDYQQQQFVHASGQALWYKEWSKKRCSTCPPDREDHPIRAAKRVCDPLTDN